MKPMIEFVPGNRTGHRVLLTPGPLTTTESVRAAMHDDIGTWDVDAIDLVREIREGLVALANGNDLTCTLMQGCGSMGSRECARLCDSARRREVAHPQQRRLWRPHGSQRDRGMKGCRMLKCATLRGKQHRPERVEEMLAADPSITHVACVHCETTTGLVNPVREIGLAVGRQKRRFIVDAISSFGAYSTGPGAAIDFSAGPIDQWSLLVEQVHRRRAGILVRDLAPQCR